jgi:hypothetical protein
MSATGKANIDKSLVLGWRMNPRLDPDYWLNGNARLGGQEDSHLVAVPADSMANHTAIVAQSGSGKSFFSLG